MPSVTEGAFIFIVCNPLVTAYDDHGRPYSRPNLCMEYTAPTFDTEVVDGKFVVTANTGCRLMPILMPWLIARLDCGTGEVLYGDDHYFSFTSPMTSPTL